MSKENEAVSFRTSIGGQALMEGILMRGPDKQAIVCRTKDGTYVFEFKVDGSAEEALKQIDEKGYMIPYKKEGRCVKVGVNISSATRTLDSWKVAEEV